MDQTSDKEREYKQKAVSGTIWKFLERFIAQGITLIVSLVIARILNPDDYSVVSLVAIFFTFANVIISGGLNTALIQKKHADSEDYSSVLYISIMASLVIYVGLFFLAPVIADLYQDESITLIIRIMGISLPITAIKSIWCAYISSTLQFKKFFFATLGGTIISGAVGIVMALKGFGPWALVAQQMTNTVIDTIILIAITRLKLVFKISFLKFKALFKYGWKILVSSLIATTYTETAPLIIGLKFNKTDLSFYTKGRSFPLMFSSATSNTLSAVLFPFLAKEQDDREKVLYYTRKYMQLASYIVFPIMLGLFAISENFVHVILTDKWLPAVFYIRVFCICSMFDVVAIGNCETIKAIGRSGIYLIMEIIKKSLYLVTIVLFLVFAESPEIVALSSIVCTVIQIIVNTIPNKKLIGYHYRYQIIDLIFNLVISSAMCVGVFFLGYLPINKIACLIIQIVSGIAVFILLSIITKNKNFMLLVKLSKEYIFKKRTANQ